MTRQSPLTDTRANLRGRLAPAEARAAVAAEFLRTRRAEVRALHDGGAAGGAVTVAWSAAVDELVSTLFRVLSEEFSTARGGAAVLALGGYGRTQLAPHSQLDLLLLHEGGPVDFARLSEELSSLLEDAKLKVHCVARTPRENLELAQLAPSGLCDVLEGRFLCGDLQLAAVFEAQVLDDRIIEAPDAFVTGLITEMRERHARYGDTVYLLEPQVLEGQGGLMDIHTALWLARARFRLRTTAELSQNGLVSTQEIEALEGARDFLLRVRNQLHFLCGRREDQLGFELQDECAPFFGHHDRPDGLGADALLQRYYTCANRVKHFVESLVHRSIADTAVGQAVPREVAPGVQLRGGEIDLAPGMAEDNPLAMLAAFEASQVYDAELSSQALQTIRNNLFRVDDRFRKDPDAVATFLNILERPRRVASTLLRMHDVRFLDRFIPEIEHTFCRVQRDLNHAYPVDIHSLFTVQELRRLARGDYDNEFPRYAVEMKKLERRRILYLAALLHDVGKGSGGRHEEAGAELAIRVADRMDLDTQDRAYLEFLVRDHLTLALTAQSRDLQDEELIANVAARIGDSEALRLLHLLTFADVRAVGPASWNSWKQALFQELYDKVLGVLEHGPEHRGITAEREDAARQRLRRAVATVAPGAEVEAFLTHIGSPRYLLANPVEVLLRHLDAFMARAGAPVVELLAVPAEGYTEVLLFTRDRPGLFAAVAGLTAAHGINILSAVLNTRTDGWVLDVFHVSVPDGEPLASGPRWEHWRQELVAVLSGQQQLVQVLGDRLWTNRPLGRPLPGAPARVTVDNAVSRRFTVVDVSAPDRLGLLYDVARSLAAEGLTIHLAKVATMVRRVADSFYVATTDGKKLTDPVAMKRLQHNLDVVAGTGTSPGVAGDEKS